MILAAAVGNSTTMFALFGEDGGLTVRTVFSTDPHITADQYVIQLFSIFQLHGVDYKRLKGGIIASVVPTATEPLAAAIERLVGKPPLLVGAGIRTGLDIRADMHTQLGADIVAYCVEAAARYPSPVIVVDFGTAITFSVLRGNTYEGCVIAPGVQVSLEALSQQAAALPLISLSQPVTLLGRNTVDAMRAGVIYGSAGMVDGMLDRLEEATLPAASIIATGCYMDAIVPFCRRKLIREPDLLLHGLYRLFQKNTSPR